MAILNRYTVLAGAVALACAAWAQEPPQQYQSDQYQGQYQDNQATQNQVDPPSRVARLAYLSGEVSFAPAGENDWVTAHRNRPLATGDKLFTNNGRAELGIGTSSILLDAQSNMDFLTLNDQMTQVELTQGALNLNVRKLRGGEVYEVDTPTIAFVADQIGDYRIDVDPNGQTTTVSVRRGSGDAVGEGGARVRVDEGQRVVFNDPQLSNYQTVDLRGNDNFDSYCRERVVRYERAPARRYVSEEVVGYEDLDEYGSWDEAPEYGHVWYPSGVAADWAPYHDGSWAWQDPYGWTWVDNSPWGFAPFHYGRWAYVGSRWGWIPGPVDVRPVYAPALVAFVGGDGFGVSVSVGGGGPIGWFPLGPRDVYFPSYSVGRDYFRSVNISNTVVNNTVINNYYGQYSSGNVNYASMNFANRSAPRAITAVPATAFASGRPVAASAIAVNRAQLANARIMSRATVAPTAASLVAGRARATPPPATAMNRQVVAANRPAPAPVPFAQRQALLQKNPGQPLTTAQLRRVAAAGPNGAGTATSLAARSNVRVVGTGKAGVVTPAAANARGNARATANAPNAPAMTRQEQQAQARQQQQANAAQGRVQGQLPSSRYTQRGNVPPRESATAQQNASANARFNRGNAPPTAPMPRASATAQQNASANARFNRGNASPTAPTSRESAAAQRNASANARFNRGNAPPTAPTPRESATAQQNASANARFNRGNAPPTAPTSRESATAQQNASANARFNRGNAAPTTPANRAAEARANAQAQQQQRASEQRMQAQNRAAESRTNAQAQQQSRASEQRIAAQQRAQQQQERASSQRMEAQSRAAESRANAQAQAREEQRAQAQMRAGEQQRMQAQAREQQRAQAQSRAPERAPMQATPQQQRAQAQYREPPRPTNQREQPQPRQQAKRRNEKDRDQQNGGGG